MSTENNNNDNYEDVYTGEESNNQPQPPPNNGFSFGSSNTSINNPGLVFGGGVAMGAFPRPPFNTTAGGFGTFSGLQPTGTGGRVERHPETGQPIPMGCNLMPPQGVCGGIRTNNPNNNILFGQRPNEGTVLNKKKSIDDLYKKLASARAQIQALNKVIDEIYETLPNIN